ncbi:hypothetical protein JCM8547_005959 [Rhodosporidiobolus lusitaniae]
MVQTSLVGPAKPERIAAFLQEHVPSYNSGSFGEMFTVKRDAEVELPAGEQWQKSKFNGLVREASPYLDQMTSVCALIAEHAPTRGRKSHGVKSQTELREHEHAKFHYNMKTVAENHGVLSGCWTAFVKPEDVDDHWSRVVEELASEDGALATAGATYAKVSSSYGERSYVPLSLFCPYPLFPPAD